MKPTKTFSSIITMLTLFFSVVFIAGCQKDGSIDNSGSAAVAADSYSGGSSGNKNPVSKAGADQTITLPVSSVSFDGSSSSDPDGTIKSYAWTKEIGTGGTITSATAAKTTVTALTAGNYRFRLTVTDNKGATASDTVHVTVKGTGSTTPPPPGNQLPVVNAGAAKTITLPISSVTLAGSATDADGTIASYLWTKVSGTGGTIASPNAASTNVTGLTAGSYVFNLKATDNSGGSANKTVTVTVNASSSTPPPTNPPPAAGYTLTYSNGFDTNAQLDPDDHGQIGSGSLNTSASYYVTGPGSFKSVPANVSAGIRSEVQFDDTRTASEGAIEYDVMYGVVAQNNCHSLQFHPNTSGGSASPGLWHEGGKFEWVNWKGGTNTKYPTNVTIQANHWYHVRLEYKFGSAGYLHFFLDGTEVLQKDNIQVGDGSGQYLKVGVNEWVASSSTVYYDNLKIYKKG